MSERHPDSVLTDEAIVSWKNRMSNFNMSGYFGRRPCSIAKGVFATNVIRSVKLMPEKAFINAYFNGETIDFEISIDENGDVTTSIDKKEVTSQIVTIAALMAIDKIINSAKNDSEHVGRGISDGQYEQYVDGDTDFGNGGEKTVLVKFNIVGNDVVMRAYLDNDIKKPIFMYDSDVVSVISRDDKKMSLLRLLYYARRSKFEFCSQKRDYRLKNLRDAVELVVSKLGTWEKFFFVELSDDVLLLKNGVIFPEICARVTGAGNHHVMIEWRMSTKYGDIPSEMINDLLRANGRPVFVKDIGAVALTSDQINSIRHVFCNDPSKKLNKYMLYTLLNQNHVSVDMSCCDIASIEVGQEKFPLPDFLKNYQKDGIYAMRAILDAGCHCLLADEMGLGKTLQAISLICSDNECTRNLIVCPASVTFVWKREIEKFFPEKSSAIVDRYYDLKKEVDFLICSYSYVHKLNDKIKDIAFDYMVIDEAQYAKNPRSKTMVSCCNITSKYRIAITGTPIENNLVDVWSIFKFLMPGFFCGYKQFLDSIGYQDFRENFKKQVATFTVRRTKKSVAIELPKRNEIDVVCQMSGGQKSAYESIMSQLKHVISKTSDIGNIDRMNVLTMIMRLRQAACAQFVLPETLQHDHSTASPKLDALFVKLENIAAGGKKVVIFSQFLKMLDEISKKIKSDIPSMAVYTLTGNSGNKESVVEDFQSADTSAAILVSLKAGGVGITLHSAEYAFLMEPWWNPAVEEQAIARIHRIGQKNITTIYRMITEGSIEERMRDIQSSKKDLFNEFIRTGVDNIAMTNFYLKNLENLLS